MTEENPAPKNIAILGCVNHREQAPFDDPNWEIWFQHDFNLQRWDRCFEVHDLNMIRHGATKPIWDWMVQQDGTRPIYVWPKVCSEIKGSVVYPRDEMVREFGAHCFDSTVAWMMALAILMKPKIIGLYGIDFASDAEYREQKPGVRALMFEARKRGIDVVGPAESEMMVPPYLYAIDDNAWIKAKIERLKLEQETKLAEIRDKQKALDFQALMINGTINTLNHQKGNWFR